jgi:hypothetical protein
MFHLFFQTFIASVFIWMLYMFHTMPPSLSAPHLPPRHAHSSSRISPHRAHSSRNLVNASVVDELDVFGSAGVDNDDLLWAFINADLPSGDLNLDVWKFLAIAMLSFASVSTLLGYLVQAAR